MRVQAGAGRQEAIPRATTGPQGCLCSAIPKPMACMCRLELAGRKQDQELQKARRAAEAAEGHHAQQRSLQLAQRLIHKRLAQIFRYLAGTPWPQC